jgi:hypothetical protein
MEKKIYWNELKSERVKKLRGLSFDEILGKEFIGKVAHPNRRDQEALLFYHNGQIWFVPFVETETYWFLKTLYPSRKYTKIYKKMRGDYETD